MFSSLVQVCDSIDTGLAYAQPKWLTSFLDRRYRLVDRARSEKGTFLQRYSFSYPPVDVSIC